MKRKINFAVISILILGIGAIFGVQFLIPTLYDADSYLHIRMAEFLREMGPHYDFHWARFSVFAEHFSDKDFLFHVFLIPFTFFNDIFFGAKFAAVIFAGLLFLAFYRVLRNYSDKALLPFFLLSFFLPSYFLFVISLTRPIAIVILFTILSLHFLIKKRSLPVFFLALLCSLTHVTGPLMIFYALVVETVRYGDKKEFYSKSVLAAFLGVLAGFLIHPNFPNNFYISYLNGVLVPIYVITGEISENAWELLSYTPIEYLLRFPLVVIGVILIALTFFLKKPKIRFATKVFLALGGVYLALSFVSRRCLPHGYLIILIAFASYFSDFMTGRKYMRKALVIAYICAAIIFVGSTVPTICRDALYTNAWNIHYERVGKWMAKNIPEGEVIFHAEWSDSQRFIGLNPKNDYLVTLDPVYMYKWNPELYKVYNAVSMGETSDPYVILRDTFKVKYGYAGIFFNKEFIKQIENDSRFRVRARDSFGIVFELIKERTNGFKDTIRPKNSY